MANEDGKRKRCASGDDESERDRGGVDAANNGSVRPSHNGAAPVLATDNSIDHSPARDNADAHKRKKWTRLLLRELYDLGYRSSAECLEREASVQLRSDAMKALEAHVRALEWDAALAMVTGTQKDDRELSMKSPAAAREAALLLLRRKYIDFLMKRELRAALQTFQQEILPVYSLSEEETKQLAILLLCTESGQLEQLASIPWKEADLLAQIEQLVSPDEIIPEGALQVR